MVFIALNKYSSITVYMLFQTANILLLPTAALGKLCRTLLILVIAQQLAPDLSAKLIFSVTSISDKAELGAEKYPFTFAFKNDGDQSVEITRVKTSCGCTTAELDKKIYKPGEIGEIKGVFNIGKRQGVQKKTVTVFTNNLGQPEIKLGLDVTVPKLLEIKPGLLVWHLDSSPDPKTIQILPGDASVDISSIKCESDAFAVQLMPMEDVARGYEILVAPSNMDETQRAVIKIFASIEGSEPKTYFAHALIK
ncbi:DUF1573 domain-containing protein [Cerasicoccus arenae]|uniref:DUF1573 domain-containing protein n=1 Tax=Cerasicoccus arenae TaxID=424488 RepID=A0A8J3DIH2_9BACT|nr:DUF1573 domain-containing protein [Cerasicoccus arenae]MBK1858028.1 DUF1573 domain-containing protein [Cerasicoccus arenae]GHC06601.1 hypothetical protein GCM10007047_24510 [Cerasicoccus arenae]